MTCGASGTGNIPTTPQSVRAWGGLKAPAYSRTPSSAPWATASLASPI